MPDYFSIAKKNRDTKIRFYTFLFGEKSVEVDCTIVILTLHYNFAGRAGEFVFKIVEKLIAFNVNQSAQTRFGCVGTLRNDGVANARRGNNVKGQRPKKIPTYYGSRSLGDDPKHFIGVFLNINHNLRPTLLGILKYEIEGTQFVQKCFWLAKNYGGSSNFALLYAPSNKRIQLNHII